MVAAHEAMLGGREKVNSHRHRGLSSQATDKFFPRGGEKFGSRASMPAWKAWLKEGRGS